MMKKIIAIIAFVTFHFSLPTFAQQTVQELFVTMPEEKTPLLSLNDKKEMIECWNQKLDTSVRNKLGGSSRIDTLTDDCIRIHLSEAKSLTLFIIKSKDQPSKIGIITTLYTPKGESKLEWYDEQWNRIDGPTPEPSPMTPDDEFVLLEYSYDMQTKDVKANYNYPIKGEKVNHY